jgi:V8-like Glu-specific endopeptidase
MNRLTKWVRKLSSARPATARRRPTARPTLESLEERAVPSLTPVSANAGYPFTSICKMYMWFPDGKEFQASGAVVDSFHVMTAGHCVYDGADGGWATSIEVIPEMSGSSQPFGAAWMTYERTYSTWINYSNSNPGKTAAGDMDIALVTLNRNIGYSTGWMGFGWDSSYIDYYNLNTAGYPAQSGYNGQGMYYDYTSSVAVGSSIYYGDGFIPGQSGSPVWTLISGQREIRGVAVGSNGLATRITQQIFDDFVNAMNSDTRPASAAAPVAAAAAGSPLLAHAVAPSFFLDRDVAAGLLAGLTGGGQGRDLPKKVDALFAARSVAAPAATNPAPAAPALPASAASPHHAAGSASLVLDELSGMDG